MPDTELVADILKLIIVASFATAAYGWTRITAARAHEARVRVRTRVGRQRRLTKARIAHERASRLYRWRGRLELAAAYVPIKILTDLVDIISPAAKRRWAVAKDLEAADDDAYALRALPGTTLTRR